MAREDLAFHIGKKTSKPKTEKRKKKKKKHTPRTQPDPFQDEN